MNEELRLGIQEEKKINALLEKRIKFSEELNKRKKELSDIETDKSDSENRTEQNLNSEETKRYYIIKIQELETIIKGIDNELDEIQKLNNKNN